MTDFYMHTLNRKAATFDGDQICYAITSRPISLCRSLEEIKKQRRKSSVWRAKQGFYDMDDEYGHFRVNKP